MKNFRKVIAVGLLLFASNLSMHGQSTLDLIEAGMEEMLTGAYTDGFESWKGEELPDDGTTPGAFFQCKQSFKGLSARIYSGMMGLQNELVFDLQYNQVTGTQEADNSLRSAYTSLADSIKNSGLEMEQLIPVASLVAGANVVEGIRFKLDEVINRPGSWLQLAIVEVYKPETGMREPVLILSLVTGV